MRFDRLNTNTTGWATSADSIQPFEEGTACFAMPQETD